MAFLLFCSGSLKRVAAGGAVLGNVGRTPAFQPHTIAQLTADAVIMDRRQTSHTPKSLAKRLRQEQLDEQSNPSFDSKPLSRPTIRKYSKQIAPVAEKGGVNTNARAAALVDLRNFISAAAVSGAALTGVYPELLFNTDVVKLYLCEDKPPQVLTTEEGSTWLKERNMQAKSLEKQVNDVLLISTSPHQRMAQFYTLLSRFATPKLLSPHAFVLPTTCHYGYFRNHTITQTQSCTSLGIF